MKATDQAGTSKLAGALFFAACAAFTVAGGLMLGGGKTTGAAFFGVSAAFFGVGAVFIARARRSQD